MSTGEEVRKAGFRLITKRVAIDNLTLTYQSLARELGITNTQSKELLDAYIKDPQNAERALSPTWALSGVLKPISVQPDAMDVDDDPSSSQPSQSQSSNPPTLRRAVILATPSQLSRSSPSPSPPTALLTNLIFPPIHTVKLSTFLTPPSTHIYALSPSPGLPTLSLLTSYSLSNTPLTTSSKYKPPPPAGYGLILHPDGNPPKRKVVNGGAKPKAKVVEAKVEAKPVASGSGIVKKGVANGGKEEKKTVVVKMGSLGGLFADKNPVAVVPAKRKAPPVAAKKAPVKAVVKEKPKTTVKNGIFDDEMDDEDEDEIDAEMEAMLAAEDEKAAKGKGKGKDKMEVDTKPVVKKPVAKTAPATKMDPKKATTNGGAAPKTATSKPINSFFTKKS